MATTQIHPSPTTEPPADAPAVRAADAAVVARAFTAARDRQASMLAEIRCRLTDLAARDRSDESAALRTEKEAARLICDAIRSDGSDQPAGTALTRRAAVLADFDELTAKLHERHSEEQHLAALADEVDARIRLLDTLTDALTAAANPADVGVQVDWALARCEGCADEDSGEAADL